MTVALHRRSLSTICAMLESGETTSEAIVGDCLDWIAAREDAIGAWAFLDPKIALQQARARDAEPRRSPLHGVPVAVKDVVDVAGMPSAWGDEATYGHRRPERDAPIVRRLRDLGAVILGKTAVSRFGFWWPGKTRNPLSPDRTPGSSSSGAAAAVADFMCPLSIGTQTGGSVSRPAAYCGIVGVLPSHGWIAWRHSRDFAPTFDVAGFFARDMADARLAHALLAGETAKPRTAPLRIGLHRTRHWNDAEPCMRTTFDEAAQRLAQAGHMVQEIALPPDYDALYDQQHLIVQYESFRQFAWELSASRNTLHAGVAELLEEGARVSDADYFAAIAAQRRMKARFPTDLGGFDMLMVPGIDGEPPPADRCGSNIFIRQWMMLHTPDVTMPFGTGPSGLPLAVRFIGRNGDDAAHLAACALAGDALAA